MLYVDWKRTFRTSDEITTIKKDYRKENGSHNAVYAESQSRVGVILRRCLLKFIQHQYTYDSVLVLPAAHVIHTDRRSIITSHVQ